MIKICFKKISLIAAQDIISESITQNQGEITQYPQEINKIFQTFYTNLYSSNINPKPSEVQSFSNNLDLPKLCEEDAEELDKPLTVEDLYKALFQMPNNKLPGPDGFPLGFYKHFWYIISPLFYKLTLEIKDKSKIPSHMNTSLISVLLKPNRDPMQPFSYRLSLISTDLKIITTALAIRLETVTSTSIHPDQTGFIKKRHGSDNIRRLFNIINLAQQTQSKTIIVSLDTENILIAYIVQVWLWEIINSLD